MSSDSDFTGSADKAASADRNRERSPLATEARLLAIETAARAFLIKYAALEPALNDAFAMKAIHGMPYRGETWADELAKLRAAVAP